VLADRLEEHFVGGQVTFLRDLPHDLGVEMVVEIVAVGVEDAVSPQAKGLVDLEVKTDGSHDESLSCATFGNGGARHYPKRSHDPSWQRVRAVSGALCKEKICGVFASPICPPRYAPINSRVIKCLRALVDN
jgi:hypothetical protein